MSPLSAAAATVLGVVVNTSGGPVSGAAVYVRDLNLQATTNFNGQFRLDVPDGTSAYAAVVCDGYESAGFDITAAPQP